MTNQKSRKRTWVVALVSIAALAVFGTGVLIGFGIYLFMSNVDIEDATPERAALSFSAARAQFIGDDPLVRLTREDGRIQAEGLRRDRPSEIRPELLHVMVWDPGGERLVNVRIPLWLLRFGSNATIDFSQADGDIVGDLDLSLEDLDYHGPGDPPPAAVPLITRERSSYLACQLALA